MKFSKAKFSLLGSMALSVFALAACGKSNPSATGLPVPAANAVYSSACWVNNTWQPCEANVPGSSPFSAFSTFGQECMQSGGFFLTISSPKQESCTFSLTETINRNGLYRLNPSDLSGNQAYSTGFTLKAGDAISYSASGFWGARKAGFLNSNCEDETNVNGYRDGVLQTSSSPGFHQGLVGSVGSEVFQMGSGGSRTITQQGILRVGFNAPVGVGICEKLSFSVKIVR